MDSYEEVQAFLDDYYTQGTPAPPPFESFSLEQLKTQAQEACDSKQWDSALAYLKELYARDYLPARTSGDIAVVLSELTRTDEAVEWYRKSLELDPSNQMLHDGLIFTLEVQPQTTVEDQLLERAKYFQQFGHAAYQKRTVPRNKPDPDRPLHIGYVSGDWNFHSAAMSFAGAITGHTENYIAHAYSTLPPKNQDWVSENWQALLGDRFVECFGLTPGQLAAVIKHDEIDILVDLSGYSARHRMQTFAYRPAPIQIQAWGFVVGTGSPMIDVIFADPIVAPPEVQAGLVERVYHLPCLLGYTPTHTFEDVSPLPCLTGPPTFGVFQRGVKINDETLSAWRAILEAVPDARIMFKGGDYTYARRLKIVHALKGLEARIIFGPTTTHAAHLNYYQQIDLSLDTWPQTGGVSTMESLAMGVPVLTMARPHGRMIEYTSASILTNVGFTDCITNSIEAYIAAAIRLVTVDRDRLADMRAVAHQRLLTSPICIGYAKAVETAYRTLWKEWCAKQLSYGTIQ